MDKKATEHSIWIIIVMIIAVVLLLFQLGVITKIINIFRPSVDCESHYAHTCLYFCGGELERTGYTCPEEDQVCCHDPEKAALYCREDDDCEEDQKCVTELQTCKGGCADGKCPQGQECFNGACLTEAERQKVQETAMKKVTFKLSTQNDFGQLIAAGDSLGTLAVGKQYTYYFGAVGDEAGVCAATVMYYKDGQLTQLVLNGGKARVYGTKEQCADTKSPLALTFTLPQEFTGKEYTGFYLQVVSFPKKLGNDPSTFTSAPQWPQGYVQRKNSFTVGPASPGDKQSETDVDKEKDDKPTPVPLTIELLVDGSAVDDGKTSLPIPPSIVRRMFTTKGAGDELGLCYFEIAYKNIWGKYKPIDDHFMFITASDCKEGSQFPIAFTEEFLKNRYTKNPLQVRALAFDKKVASAMPTTDAQGEALLQKPTKTVTYYITFEKFSCEDYYSSDAADQAQNCKADVRCAYCKATETCLGEAARESQRGALCAKGCNGYSGIVAGECTAQYIV